MREIRNHTTIGVKKNTKKRLEKARAPGQCYDGFLCQLMDLWEKANIGSVLFNDNSIQKRRRC
jgi:hypothetical protein